MRVSECDRQIGWRNWRTLSVLKNIDYHTYWNTMAGFANDSGQFDFIVHLLQPKKITLKHKRYWKRNWKAPHGYRTRTPFLLLWVPRKRAIFRQDLLASSTLFWKSGHFHLKKKLYKIANGFNRRRRRRRRRRRTTTTTTNIAHS